MRFRCQPVLRALCFAFWVGFVLNSKALAGSTDAQATSREIRENGESFVLISSARANGVETEEYGLKGETAKNWTELIIYQRLALFRPSRADEYILSLKRQIEDSPSPGKFRIVQESNRAAVFAVEYEAEKSASTELTLGLAIAPQGEQSQEIQLVQYTVMPARISIEKLEGNIQRWKARFQSEARFSFAPAGIVH